MENEFVTYEQAIQLKELGFDEPCMFVHDTWGNTKNWTEDGEGEHRNSYINASIYYSAPLKQQVFRWFRNEHQIEVTVACYYSKRLGISYEERLYHCHIIRDGITTKGPKFKTYEEGESACIDKLIEIVKKK